MKKILVCGLIGLLSACATNKLTFNVDDAAITKSQSVYIMLPENGHYGSIEYDFSGDDVQQKLAREFQTTSIAQVLFPREIKSVQESLKEAEQQNTDLLICPIITHWEDRNTPWSGRRDKVGLNIRIIDVKSKKVVSDADLYGTNNSITFIANQPNTLLPKMVKKYVSHLYNKN